MNKHEGLLPRPKPPEGGYKSESETPYIDGLPAMAWLSWWMCSHSVQEEDPIAGALVSLVRMGRAAEDLDDRDEMAFIVEGAAKHYTDNLHAPALYARVQELEAALEKIANVGRLPYRPKEIGFSGEGHAECIEIARAALEDKA